MQPSLYNQLPADRRRKFVRYVLEFFVLGAVASFLFQLEAQHWLLQILLGAVLLRQVIVIVKLLNVTTINPKLRSTSEPATEPLRSATGATITPRLDLGRRPYYHEYAWAFDLLNDRPVREDVDAIVRWLTERGVRSEDRVLDAGCGTGRYSRELGSRGYQVLGIDLSPELIAQATKSQAVGSQAVGVESVSFAVGNITVPQQPPFAAVLCRGVLNDLTGDADRSAALTSFAKSLRPEGVLIVDVREWNGTQLRKAAEPMVVRTVVVDQGHLTFTSTAELDVPNHRLLLTERHSLLSPDGETTSDHDFVMQCWTQAELEAGLTRAGFRSISFFGGYDLAIRAGTTDRLVAVATCGQDAT